MRRAQFREKDSHAHRIFSSNLHWITSQPELSRDCSKKKDISNLRIMSISMYLSSPSIECSSDLCQQITCLFLKGCTKCMWKFGSSYETLELCNITDSHCVSSLVGLLHLVTHQSPPPVVAGAETSRIPPGISTAHRHLQMVLFRVITWTRNSAHNSYVCCHWTDAFSLAITSHRALLVEGLRMWISHPKGMHLGFLTVYCQGSLENDSVSVGII